MCGYSAEGSRVLAGPFALLLGFSLLAADGRLPLRREIPRPARCETPRPSRPQRRPYRCHCIRTPLREKWGGGDREEDEMTRCGHRDEGDRDEHRDLEQRIPPADAGHEQRRPERREQRD